MESQDDIRGRIQQRLEALDLGVKPASIKAGLGETTLRNFLVGTTRSMTGENLNKVAGALQVSPAWLVYGETAEVVRLWDKVPVSDRPKALRVLASFVPEGGLKEDRG